MKLLHSKNTHFFLKRIKKYEETLKNGEIFTKKAQFE